MDSSTTRPQYHLAQNIVGWMMINKTPLLSNDFPHDSRFSGVKVEEELRSLLCVPLLIKNRLIGILTVCNKKDIQEFSGDDQRLLTIIATQSAQVLDNARLYEQEKSLLTIQEEIKLAAKIQSELLPKQSPAVPGYEIAGRSIPAQQVGGDYYDFVSIDEHRTAIILGDVSGKGLPASLLMANLQATLRGQTIAGTSVKECISRANKLLYRSTSSEKFATLFYGVLNADRHQLTYCNAGHDPPFLIIPGKTPLRLETGGIVLSIMEQYSYEEETVSLNPGDVLLVYSDGISEAMNCSGEQFGEEAIARIAQKNEGLGAENILYAVLDAARIHTGAVPQWDDMTIMIVKRLR